MNLHNIHYYCTLMTGCSNNASRLVMNWKNMGFIMHHTSWWTPTKITTVFPIPKQPKISVLNYFNTFSCHVIHHNSWWTFCQWTLGIMHHRLWTSSCKSTVFYHLSIHLSTHLSTHIEPLHHLLQNYDDLARRVKAYVTQFAYLVLGICLVLLEAPMR